MVLVLGINNDDKYQEVINMYRSYKTERICFKICK